MIDITYRMFSSCLIAILLFSLFSLIGFKKAEAVQNEPKKTEVLSKEIKKIEDTDTASNKYEIKVDNQIFSIKLPKTWSDAKIENNIINDDSIWKFSDKLSILKAKKKYMSSLKDKSSNHGFKIFITAFKYPKDLKDDDGFKDGDAYVISKEEKLAEINNLTQLYNSKSIKTIRIYNQPELKGENYIPHPYLFLNMACDVGTDVVSYDYIENKNGKFRGIIFIGNSGQDYNIDLDLRAILINPAENIILIIDINFNLLDEIKPFIEKFNNEKDSNKLSEIIIGALDYIHNAIKSKKDSELVKLWEEIKVAVSSFE